MATRRPAMAGGSAGVACYRSPAGRTTAPPAPAWATAGLKKSDDIQTKVRALLAERRQRIGYEAQLLAANRACQ
ncbi:hypothetical protein [Pseudomonas aeruginosa]|uniref:hypothetical protein n=1 Tax=Pseudomonas aeruginosa TaxID=287 RepID=UPI0039F6F298